MTRDGKAKSIDMRAVKARLSEVEYHVKRDKIDAAIQAIREVGGVLEGALLLGNGSLSTGDIRYAAFRVQTLSLVFELARKHFLLTGNDGNRRYATYLEDLGDEVGLTFARELMGRLAEHRLLAEVQSVDDLLNLWALYENETGAGETTILRVNEVEEIAITLRKNPLRSAESAPHAHCGFYRAYLRSLLNEFLSLRARKLAEAFNAKIVVRKVHEVQESTESEGDCLFRALLRKEELEEAFTQLEMAFASYEAGALGDALISARAAIVRGQCDKLGIDPGKPPAQLYKVFKGLTRPDEYGRMRDVYQRASWLIHPENRPPTNPAPDYVYEILKDVRRVLYSLESASIDPDEAVNLASEVRFDSLVAELHELLTRADELDSAERNDLIRQVQALRKAPPGDERASVLRWLKERLSKLKDPTARIAERVIAELITASAKRGVGLG